ncbi:hypothetical protein CPC08DRAFT_107412 [Agrocybe pediades]|nr:hypothetical protein CPC08DRAFT_107412 [Agrocybe pediades]
MHALWNTFSPISILHEDLIYRIFLESTNGGRASRLIAQRQAIVTAIRCSHVCRLWRKIILSASKIWGRLIDVCFLLGRKTDEWLKEVVARAGKAPLWVYDYRFMSARDEQNGFIWSFLRENWSRVELLTFGGSEHPDGMSLLEKQKIWAFLQEPAPHLRWIDLTLYDHDADKFLPSHLFSNNAPRLTDFCIMCTESDKFNLVSMADASWTSNLCAISISWEITTKEVLAALRRMPRLAHLGVSCSSDGPLAVDCREPQVLLPRLTRLQVSGYLSGVGAILQHITPSADCCLSVSLSESEDMELSELPDHGQLLYEQYEAAVAKYLLPYISQHPPSTVRFGLDRVVSFFGCFPSREHLGVSLYTPFLSSSSLLQQLNGSSCWSGVSDLRLNVYDGEESEYNRSALYFGPCLGIVPTLRALSSITTLSTCDDGLHVLLQEPSITATLFPALTVLKINFDLWAQEHPAELEEWPHHRFLRLRREIGRPLSIFKTSLSKESLVNEDLDLDYLEEHVGLIFEWQYRDQEPRRYVCGRGTLGRKLRSFAKRCQRLEE